MITYALVIALNLSWPAVSQIWALIVLESTWILLVANSTPIVDLDSKLNSLRVKRDNKLDLPTPESPIKTTVVIKIVLINSCNNYNINYYCVI